MGADAGFGLPDYESTVGASPTYQEEAQPVTFILEEADNRISADGLPFYTISRSLRAIQQRPSSILLERVETTVPKKPDSAGSPTTFNNLIFYLVHPKNVRYRDDKPHYYATCNKSCLGNIVLEIEKKTMSKAEYKTLLYHGTSASSDPLFTGQPTTIFSAKPGLLIGKHTWTDCEGEAIAQEQQGKGQKLQLKITRTLKAELRDALVAAWCLKMWSEVAESRESKRDELERLTPAEGLLGMDTKWYKRTGAMGAFAGIAGGG